MVRNFTNTLICVSRTLFFMYLLCLAVNSSFNLYFCLYCLSSFGTDRFLIFSSVVSLLLVCFTWIRTAIAVSYPFLFKIVFYTHIVRLSNLFFSYYTLVWTLPPTKCWIINVTRIWEIKEANIITGFQKDSCVIFSNFLQRIGKWKKLWIIFRNSVSEIWSIYRNEFHSL